MNSNDNIHPVIQGWVEKLLDERTPFHIRENYFATLKETEVFIENALRRFTQEKQKRYNNSQFQKRAAKKK